MIAPTRGIPPLRTGAAAPPVLLILATLLLSAAAADAAAATEGQRLLRSGRYAEARAALARESAAKPGSAALLRDFGAARLRAGDPAGARETLRAALRKAPADPAARYYLGVALEEADSLSAALAEYAAALRGSKTRPLSRELRARMSRVTRKVLAAEARASIRNEKKLTVESFPENSVAVLAFENVSRSERLAPLSTGLSAMVATDLSRVRALRLVEREKLPVLLRELELERSKAFDPKTTARVGKLLGARRLVKGLFLAPDEVSIQLDATTVETRTGEAAKQGAKASGGLDAFFALEKRLVLDLVGAMGITLSPAERAEIERTPTKDLLAFLAFSRGLELEDGGDLAGAAGQYREAIRRDPGFAAAVERLEEVEGPATDTAELDRAILGPPGPTGLEGRIRATGERASEGFLPDFDHGEGWNARVSPPEVVQDGRGTISVIGTLPRSPRRASR